MKKSAVGSSSCKYHIGQDVEIYYNDRNPKQFYVKGNFSGIIWGAGFAVFGVIIMIII